MAPSPSDIRLVSICWKWLDLTILLLQLLSPTEARVVATQMSSNIVETQYGKIRGILMTLPNRNLPSVEVYMGLQYASLLGGELRFMPPTSSMEKWESTRVAIRFRPVCPQKILHVEQTFSRMPIGRVEHLKRILPFLEKQSEECLNLNLYVPVKGAAAAADKNDSSPLFSVVLFVHGESYEMGSGNAYDGSILASYGQVIVVTINYRLGPIGFLSTGDSNAPGNYALLDLVAALHWVKENIQVFGGDPNSVTLMGHGYGSALVNLLMISPITKGRNLFQRAIVQSGSAFSSWSVTSDPLYYARQLADALNCTSRRTGFNQNADLMHCLKQIPADQLVNADVRAPRYFSAFGPTIDRRSVLPLDPRRMAAKASDSVFASTKILVGVTRNEGFQFFDQREVDGGLTVDRMRQIVRTYVQNVFRYHRQYIFDVLVHQYTDWDRPGDSGGLRDSAMELIGDGQYVAPSMELTLLHARLHAAPTYLYTFSYPGRIDSYPKWANGVHGDEMAFAFGAPLSDDLHPFPSVFSQTDKVLSETVLRYWTNFAKTGNPNAPRSRGTSKLKPDAEWPIFDLDKQQFLHIEKKMQDRLEEGLSGSRLSPRHHYKGAKMALWLDLIPRLHKSDNLDDRYHRLDNSDNLTTFEAEGTRFSPLPEDVWTTSDFRSPTAAQPATTVTMTTATSAWRSTSGAGVMARRMSTLQVIRTSPSEDEDHEVKSQGPGKTPSAVSRDQLLVQASSESTLSLSLTVGVGCFLLFLNVLIFAAMYYQKDRMKRERRLMKREMEHEQQMLAHIDASSGCGGGGGGGVGEGATSKSLLSSDIYSNCDGTATPLVPSIPPLPPAVFSKNHRPQQQQQQPMMFIHSSNATNQSRPSSQPVYANATSLCSPGWSQTIDANHSSMTNNVDALHRLLTSPPGFDPDANSATTEKSVLHENPSTVV